MFFSIEFWHQLPALSTTQDSWANQLQASQEALTHHSYLQVQCPWSVLRQMLSLHPSILLLLLWTETARHQVQQISERWPVLLLIGPKCTGQTHFTNSNLKQGGLQHQAVLPSNTKYLTHGQHCLTHFYFRKKRQTGQTTLTSALMQEISVGNHLWSEGCMLYSVSLS